MTNADANWIVQTEVFDGPLDLLLYLIRRDGIDVREIQVALVADSYLAYLDRMRELNLSIASDYLVMAATLCHLKSLELLPRPPTPIDEDAEDPREALKRQLIEYARHKEAAGELDRRLLLGRDVFARESQPIASPARPLRGVEAFALLDCYWELLRRTPKAEPVYEIATPLLDFGACCRQLLELLHEHGGRVDLREILTSIELRAVRVLTFLAALEMGRLGYLSVEQEGHLQPVWLKTRVGADADLGVLEAIVRTETA